ncbi:hypothetical protein Hanom_Chr12g01098341 [Helianthus anomalus]
MSVTGKPLSIFPSFCFFFEDLMRDDADDVQFIQVPFKYSNRVQVVFWLRQGEDSRCVFGSGLSSFRFSQPSQHDGLTSQRKSTIRVNGSAWFGSSYEAFGRLGQTRVNSVNSAGHTRSTQLTWSTP